MPRPKNILIVAGEESGDQHASELVRELQLQRKDLNFYAVGGVHLQSAGAELLVNLAQYGVTGISEVVRHLRIIRQAFDTLKGFLRSQPIDLIVLVDYPGFNLRLAKYVKQNYGTPILYYISPQIWAWKAKRINTIKKYVDHMAVILPFEKNIYAQAAVPASFVGHPLLKKVYPKQTVEDARKELHLSQNKLLIAILPGSRKNEIERLMPVLAKAMLSLHTLFPEVEFCIPIASTITSREITRHLPEKGIPLHFFNQNAKSVIQASDLVIVASGTASLECALMGKPGCIVYKASELTGILASQLIKIPYIGLANIIMGAMVIPELLQNDCNAEAITNVIRRLIQNRDYYCSMQESLEALHAKLSHNDCELSTLVCQLLAED